MSEVAMDGIIALGKAKQLINGVATGVSRCEYDPVTQSLKFICNDGTPLTIPLPYPLSSEEIAMIHLMKIEKDANGKYEFFIDGEKVGDGGGYTGKSGVDLGGIKLNQQFNNASVQEMFDFLLHPYEKPSMTLGINPVKTIYDKIDESLGSITINANVTKKTEDIAIVRFYIDNVLVHTDTTHPTGGLVSYTHTFSPATNKTFNVKIECEDIKGASSKVSANTNIYFVGKSYYGVIEDDGTSFVIDETLIKSLTETQVKIKKALTYENITATYGRIVYAYPKDLPTGGELTSIKDKGTGWSVFDSYAKQEITIDGIDYICYYLIDAAGFDGVTMIFE